MLQYQKIHEAVATQTMVDGWNHELCKNFCAMIQHLYTLLNQDVTTSRRQPALSKWFHLLRDKMDLFSHGFENNQPPIWNQIKWFYLSRDKTDLFLTDLKLISWFENKFNWFASKLPDSPRIGDYTQGMSIDSLSLTQSLLVTSLVHSINDSCVSLWLSSRSPDPHLYHGYSVKEMTDHVDNHMTRN
jgi:hypothetical protein